MKIPHASNRDMAVLSLSVPFTAPEAVPLTYTADGVVYRGISRDILTESRREVLDANLVKYTVCGELPCGLCVTVEAVSYRDFPVTEWVAYFRNGRGTVSPILEDVHFDFSYCQKDAVLEHASGDTCGEDGYRVVRDSVCAEPMIISPWNGTPCQGASPYMRLYFDGCGVNLAIGWPATWYLSAAETENRLKVSVGQKRCHMSLLPGEVMRTPRVTLMGFTGGETEATNLWRKWYLVHVLPRENGNPLTPYLCLHMWNVDGAEFTGATEEKQLNAIDTYMKRGMTPDIWWMDAGWYPCDGDWTRTGTWEPDSKRFPHGLAPLGERCDAYGTRFLLWYEPERIRRGTWLWENHRDWILEADDTGDCLLNLGNPECRAWLTEHVDHQIKEFCIRVYRQDFNIAPAPFWEKAEAQDRIGAVENLHVQGYLAYWDALLERNPGLWIDSCSSGGRRNDLETMRRAVPLHYTDVGYGKHPIKQLQHRYMFAWIPYFRAHNMAWDKPDGTYDGWGPIHSDAFAFQNAMAPCLTNMTTYDGPEEEFETARVMLPIWRRCAELELSGDYYPLTECRGDVHDWYAMQFDDPDTGEGFIQIIRNLQVTEDTYILRMKAVDPDAEYFFENQENGDMMQLSGTDLQNGIPLTLSPRSGVVWFYHRVTL